MDRFRYVSYAQEVIFAPGALTRVGEAVERFGWKRLLLCASRSMKVGGQVDALKSALGECFVVAFDDVQPHVQDIQVEQALALAIEKEVEAVIGLGGGSPVGMAKAVAYALSN